MSEVLEPPSLAGFEVVDLLGSGGYADVFLYEQHLPRRRVAVKVLRAHGLTDAGREQFIAEANVMAMLSSHPYIVTIFSADVASDGRPYLVMEYYPNPNFSVRCRLKPLSVPETLRVGVQLAGAVETAHRSGVLHRDLKPSNVLTSAFGKPGLTDFGISAVKSETAADTGLSVPWSAPEMLADSSDPDDTGDVYGLAATLYTLLAGRSPFEVPGGDNSALSLMARIEHDPVPRVGRSDVPSSLERVLAGAMAKATTNRPRRAIDLARSLQSIERELRLQPTELDIPGESELPVADVVIPSDETDRTRYRRAPVIVAQPFEHASRQAVESASDRTVGRGRSVETDERTTMRGPLGIDVSAAQDTPRFTSPSSSPVPEGASRRAGSVQRAKGSRRRVALVVIGLLLLAGAGGLALRLLGADAPSDPGPTQTSGSFDYNVNGQSGGSGLLSPPREVVVKGSESGALVSFRPAVDAKAGDAYAITWTGGNHLITQPANTKHLLSYRLPAGVSCVEVVHQRTGQLSEPVSGGCGQ